MDWLSQHIEVMVYMATSAIGFIAWNVRQGQRITEVDERHKAAMLAHKELQAEKLKNLESEITALKAAQQSVLGPLAEELKAISMKLAHIEGFMMAQQQHNPKP